MKRTLFLLLATLCLTVVWPLATQADYQYTTLDYPGAAVSAAFALDGGTIIGDYVPGEAVPCDPEVGRAYTYSGGVWTPLDYPGSVQGSAEDILGGSIVGGWIDNTCREHGFLFNGSTWTSVDYPGAKGTWVTGIYGGSVIGFFWGVLGSGDHGYVYTGGSWTILGYPGATHTHPRGIEGNNVVGEYTDNTGFTHGFLYNGSTWLTLDYPRANMTRLNRMKGGTIVGYYQGSVGGNYHGLLYENGIWTTFDFPGATSTYLGSIDGSGRLVGYYQDNAGAHGFLATPALAPTLTLTKSGTGSGTVTSSPTGINCGSTCSASYDSGTTVTLTPTPDAGSYLLVWSDPCSAARTCSPTLTGPTQITATFGLQSPAYYDTVQKVYIGYYQRPADPVGLLYWAERLNNSDGNLNDIIEAYAHSAESQALYGIIDSTNIASVINAIYRALFNRDAEAGGLAWYINGFNSGRYTAATIMLNVLNGAQNSDLASVNNKLAAANLFTRTIDPELDGYNFQVTYAGEGDAIKARSFLASVTDNPATVPTQDGVSTYMMTNIADPGDPILTH
jgi:hypothetical protein